jgi:NADPH2:quinone reductase
VADYVQRCTAGRGFDVVFDTVGGECLANSFQAARIGGTVVSIAARSTQDLAPLHAKGLTLHVVFMVLPLLTGEGRARHGRILACLTTLVDRQRLRPLLDPQVFSFRQVGEAHAKLAAGQALGKIRLDAGF